MGKSNDSELPKNLDYSSIPDEILEAVNKEPYQIKKTGKLTWDGRQYLIRVPKEIAEELDLSPDWYVEFDYQKPLPDEPEKEPRLDIRLKR